MIFNNNQIWDPTTGIAEVKNILQPFLHPKIYIFFKKTLNSPSIILTTHVKISLMHASHLSNHNHIIKSSKGPLYSS